MNGSSTPVIHIDYSVVEYRNGKQAFQESLGKYIQSIGKEMGIESDEKHIPNLFRSIVTKLYSHGGQVVVLIDEYEKPMVDLLSKTEQFEENREILRSLYSTLKTLDPYLTFRNAYRRQPLFYGRRFFRFKQSKRHLSS